MHSQTKHFTLSALFMALGVLLPIIFHGLLLGPVFLPMFWPIALAPFFIPTSFAIMVGFLTPIVSTLFTGMPPISPPILQMMVFELIFLAGTISLLYQKTRIGTFWLILIGILVSRMVLYLSAGLMAPYLGLPSKMVSLYYFLKNIPGVLIMLGMMPLIVYRLKHENIFKKRSAHVRNPS